MLLNHSLDDESDGSNCGQSCDLVPQTVHKYRHALWELFHEGVTETGNHLTHTSDGPLLHLLVYVGSHEPLQSRVVDIQHKRLEFIGSRSRSYKGRDVKSSPAT